MEMIESAARRWRMPLACNDELVPGDGVLLQAPHVDGPNAAAIRADNVESVLGRANPAVRRRRCDGALAIEQGVSEQCSGTGDGVSPPRECLKKEQTM